MALPDPEGLTPTQLRSHRLAVRLLIPLAILLIAIVVPLYVLYDVSQVSGDSMVPTLRTGERLLITRGWSSPRRGDIVVLHWTHGATTEEIVKRVVGLPGDAIKVRGDFVTVNGKPEQFDHEIMAVSEQIVIDMTVPAGTFFFMGDNRPVSLDSRFIGVLPIADIHGRAVAVWSPVTRMRVVPSP
jgi:signal peptidase I